MRHLLFVAILLFSAAFAQVAPKRGQVPDAPKTAILTGQVVRTDTAEPIAKANVYLTRDTANPQTGISGRKTETDSRGAFSFINIPPGRYIVSAALSGYVGSHGGESSFETLALDAGDDERAVLRLAPTPVIVGHVLDEDGVPLHEAQVKVIGRSSKGLTVLRTAVTDERGEYRLYGFPPGKHVVCAVDFERRKTTMRYAPRCFPDTSDVDEAEPIRFSTGGVSPLNFVLFPENTITVHGLVTGMPVVEGKFLGTMELQLLPKWGVVSEEPRSIKVQQSSGKFETPSVLPGTYTVVASANTPAGPLAFRKTVEIEETEESLLLVELTPVNLKPVHVDGFIQFEHLERFNPNTVKVEFRPVRAAGQPGPLPDPVRATNLQPNWYTTDSSGAKVTNSLRIDAMLEAGFTYVPTLVSQPPGAYLKSVYMNGRREVPSTGLLATSSVSLTFSLATDGASIDGNVLQDDGKPVAGAIVIASPDTGDPVRSSTDQHGYFVIAGLAPGTYKLYAVDSLGTAEAPDTEFLQPLANDGQTVKTSSKETTSTQLKLIHISDDGS